MAKRKRQANDSTHSAVIYDLFQVGGVISTLILAFVFADTARGRIAIILAGCATVALVGAVYLLAGKQARRRLRFLIGAQIILATAMIVVAAVLGNSPASTAMESNAPTPTPTPTPTSTPTGTGGGTPSLLMDKANYVLRPSSFVDTNDQDKVDLDTGCPGWGDMFPHVGPRRCGDLADLIVESDTIHTADGQPAIAILPSGVTGTYASCHSKLDSEPNTSVSSLQVSSLEDGEALCVRTDRGNIALVHLDKIQKDSLGQLASLTIEFKVWAS
jgi:hypothetical protein